MPWSNDANDLCSECEIRRNRKQAARNRPMEDNRFNTVRKCQANSQSSSAGSTVLMVICIVFLAIFAANGSSRAAAGLLKIVALLFLLLIVTAFRLLFSRKNADC